MAFRHKYGVLGGGALAGSLIGRLPLKAKDIGPVSAVSYRVASRMANSLKAGYPVRSIDDLRNASVILFHAPTEQIPHFVEMLEQEPSDWPGHVLIFCDCIAHQSMQRRLLAKGFSVAMLREFGIPGRMAIKANKTKGDAARRAARAIARQLGARAVEIAFESAPLFNAAVTLASGALTILIDYAAALLRESGVRDTEAPQIAAELFERTARDYAHSGRQSWVWHIRSPDPTLLEAQIAAAGPEIGSILRLLLTISFDRFHRHQDVGERISEE